MKEILLAGLFVALSVTATMPQPISERIQTGPSPFFPVDIAWELDLAQGLTYPPAFDDERLTLPLRDGTLLTLNVRTGQQVWSRQRPVDSAPVSDGVRTFADDSSPVPSDVPAIGTLKCITSVNLNCAVAR